MFQPYQVRSRWDSVLRALEVIYYSTIKNLRGTHGNAVIGLILDVFTVILLVLVFYFMFQLMGRSLMSKVRGDLVLFLLTGIFLFLTHNKSVGAAMGSEGPTSQMMLHHPISTVLLVAANSLAILYKQTLIAMVILFIYHVAISPISIEHPVLAYGMMLAAWFSGIAIGVVLYALKPWFPRLVPMIANVYRRANMIASGKMVVANALPASIIAVFDWNPLFHAIDQARGFTFLNYNPHHSSYMYPIVLGIVFIMIGLIGEYYTRRMASLHWNKGF